jgi:pilus assembly protein TadC
MLFDLLELLNDEPIMLFLLNIGLAGLGGALPPILERSRRRGLENSLAEVLEGLSDSIGAGQGLQQAIMKIGQSRNDLFGKLLSETLEVSAVTSFDAALADFALKTRSKQIQRVINLLSTAEENGAPLQEILFRMSMEYEKLNELMNKRESELMGRAILIMMFIGVGLPGLIAFISGLFAPSTAGYDVEDVNSALAKYFGASAAVAVLVSGRMLGRMKDYLWLTPLWMFGSMLFFMLAYNAIV